MTSGRRQRRGQGAELRAVPAAPEVTLVVRPTARGRGQTYLERASLIAMTEKPVIVMSHPLPGEQTQIVRRPVRKANARRWIFIFGGAAATATLLVAWLGVGRGAPVAHPNATTNPVVAKAAPPAVAVQRATQAAARPIVAPLAERSVAAPVAVARRPAGPVGATSGRHFRAALARSATSRSAQTPDPLPYPGPLRGRGQTVGWARTASVHRAAAARPATGSARTTASTTVAWVV